ncbi:hypothetical protein AAG570_003735 [Ranatra chinensis]|uniref:Uncharacterized protein n=1 Tax=Ranatra chinensis TaxID=642074 RepID=A0ABD0Y4J8_9HEMI
MDFSDTPHLKTAGKEFSCREGRLGAAEKQAFFTGILDSKEIFDGALYFLYKARPRSVEQATMMALQLVIFLSGRGEELSSRMSSVGQCTTPLADMVTRAGDGGQRGWTDAEHDPSDSPNTTGTRSAPRGTHNSMDLNIRIDTVLVNDPKKNVLSKAQTLEA